ncbi:DUF397 domain-containing protein [Streptomyces sp. NPDC058284]|uniref:DUF397 domain-containing protein n=1 Tax=unclassified Streptomyces TaxID=2593676 RepID=UPI00365F6B27
MPELPTPQWQKSTFSPDSSNCVYISAPAPTTIHLRESDTPEAILITAPTPLHALIQTLKAARRHGS